jgi:hypothetical protein
VTIPGRTTTEGHWAESPSEHSAAYLVKPLTHGGSAASAGETSGVLALGHLVQWKIVGPYGREG